MIRRALVLCPLLTAFAAFAQALGGAKIRLGVEG